MTKGSDYSAMTAQTIATETEAALAEADRLVGAAVAAHPPTFDTTIRPLREGVMSAQVGRRYRREVLEPFWSVPRRERTRNFLGREPSEQAFLERIGIAR